MKLWKCEWTKEERVVQYQSSESAHLGGRAAVSARMGADTERGTASSSSATRAVLPPSMSDAPAHRSLAHFLAPGPAAGGSGRVLKVEPVAAVLNEQRSVTSFEGVARQTVPPATG